MSTPSPKKPLGLILQEADLISVPQIQLALKDQACFKHLRLGEILALRGWIKQETADFFAEQWPQLINNPNPQHLPIGYYLKVAGLLNDEQIDDILVYQKILGTKFGSTAIMKGWVKQKTVKFFLENLFCKPRNCYSSQAIQYSEDLLADAPEQTKMLYVGEPYITTPEITTLNVCSTVNLTTSNLSSTLSTVSPSDFEWIEA